MNTMRYSPPPDPLRFLMKAPAWQILTVYCFFCLYLIGGSLVLNSREIADFSLAESIVRHARFDIPFIERTGDLATRNGLYYVDRGPGNGLVSIPFYFLSVAFRMVGFHKETSILYSARIAAALIGALGLLIFMRLSYDMKATAADALLAVLALGAGTIHWKYSTIFYSHITSSTLLLLTLWMTFRLMNGEPDSRLFRGFLGFILGFNVLVEYANAFVVLIVLSVLMMKSADLDIRGRLRRILPVILGGLAPLVFLLFYHWVCFGHPLSTGFQHQIYFDYNKSFADAFSTPWSVGIPGLLISIRYQGLFFASPVAFFGLPAFPILCKRLPRQALAIGLIFLSYLLFYAHYRVFWGATSDTRYLVPVIPLLFLALPEATQRLFVHREWNIARILVVTVFFALFFRSIFWTFLSTASFYDHPFDVPELTRIVLFNEPRAVLRAFRAAFPSLEWARPFIALGAMPVILRVLLVAFRAKGAGDASRS